jgi:hypothetical protein
MDIRRINFDFIYANNSEKIFENYGKYSKNEKILIGNDDIGSCFCSILNDKNRVISLKQKFDKTYMNKYPNEIQLLDIKEIIDLTYNKLVDINKYFVILYNKFNKISNESQMTKRLDKLERIYNCYMNDVAKILDNIINTITSFENISANRLSFKDITIPSCSMALISNEHKLYQYTYTIYTLDDLLSVSFYILSNNQYHLKQCIYPNCNKFFVTKLGQTRYCNNPCPADPSNTCRSIRKKVNHNLKMKYWEVELDALYNDVNSSREFFNYYIRKSNNQKEIKMLELNKENFTTTLKILKQYISGCTDDNKRNEYLKIYKDFVTEVRNNQKLPKPIFKVKKPKLIKTVST